MPPKARVEFAGAVYFLLDRGEPHKGDRRYVRRDKKGQFKTEVDVGVPSPLTVAAPPNRASSQGKAIAAR